MNKENLKQCLTLYAVTDRQWASEETLYEQVEKALKGGVTLLQLREKDLNEKDFMEEGKQLKELCREYGVPFVINDNVALAEKIDADGVHVGQKDMETGNARAILGDNKIIGVSARTVEQAKAAAAAGADYISVGAVFGTTTKDDAVKVTIETVKEIVQSVNIPVISIGGINGDNVEMLKDTGICGVAVISGIFANKDIEKSTRALKSKVEKTLLPEMKGIIFDVDGTLLDTMPIWTDSGARYLKSIGVVPEERLGDKLFAMTTDGGAVYLKENYNLSQSLSEIKSGITAIVAKAYAEYADFKPGAKELLNNLREKNIPMIIASSTESHLLKTALNRLGYLDYFTEILSCGDLKTTKNEPDIFYRAVNILGTEIENTWIFEDGLYAIKTGKKEGFPVVGVYDVISHKDQKEIKEYSDIYVKDLIDFNII